MVNTNLALTYDDIQLRPQYSEIASRSDISLKTRFTRNYTIDLPYMASCMDTICETGMAQALMELGAVGCIHRFMSIDLQCNMVGELTVNRTALPVVAAIGANVDAIARAMALMEAGVNVLLIDVAHGHHINVKHTLERLKDAKEEYGVDIIAGSVATGQATRDLCEWGADAVRVGIGNGSMCTTRIKTGHGVPSITSIFESARIADQYEIPIIADGNLNTSGNIAKAIAVGASSVMIASLISGTKETPTNYIDRRDQGEGLWKLYRGSASVETKQAHGQSTRNVEGVATLVRDKGGVRYVIQDANDGLRSALSYSGTNTIEEFRKKASFDRITQAGQIEATPHGLRK